MTVTPADWPDAIADIAGAQLVVAGPGTGKTEFIVRRAAHLVTRLGVDGSELLALSFSRRSAGELRDRIEAATGGVAVTSGTFHSFALRVLEAHGGEALGWTEVPRLLTGPEQVALVRELLVDEDRSSWSVAFRGILDSFTFAEEVTDFLLRASERGVTASDIEGMAATRQDWRGLAPFLDRYRRHLEQHRLIDYGTLQLAALDVITRPTVAAALARSHRYLLVDEYQDTTPTQARLVGQLARLAGNVIAAADPYQSIYGFRGTDLGNVAHFEETFRDLDPRRIVLSESFRVPSEILAAAERITSAGPLPGAAGPVTPAPHRGRVDVYVFDQQSQEADWISGEIQRLHVEEGHPYHRIAVLVRSTRRFLPDLVRALDRQGVPHDHPGKRLVDHPAIQVVFDVVRLALGGRPDAPTMEMIEGTRAASRLLLGPLLSRPLGVQRELLRRHRAGGVAWPELLRDVEETELADLVEDSAWCRQLPAAQGLWTIWSNLGALRRFAHGDEWRTHRGALASLSQVLERLYERTPEVTLVDYMRLSDQEDFQATPLLASAPPGEDRLTVTTMHQAKGLEFDAVFIADASEGILPDLRRQRSLLQPEQLSDRSPGRADKIREEMRLAYTAMTRARSLVVWSATRAGVDELQQRPSRFLTAVAQRPESEIGPPADRRGPPITALEAESRLRRTLVDPGARDSSRLAALAVLVERPNPILRPAGEFAGARRRRSETGLLPDEFTLSPSQAARYEQCPRRYALERQVGIELDIGLYAEFGTIIHTALETAERRAMEEGRQRSTFEEALQLANELIDETDFGGGAFQQAWKKRAGELLERLYREWPRPDAEPVLLEHPLKMSIAGVPWFGKADRIERDADILRIVDYKTSARPISSKEAAESVQLGFYLLAAQADEDVTRKGSPAEAEFWYPLTARKSMIVAFDPGRLGEVSAHLTELTGRIRAEDWEPVVSRECERCAVRLVCPEWPEGRESYVR